MKRLLAILLLGFASLADAQTYLTNACVILVTNAANTHALWVNLGSDPGDFTQGNPGTIPTNQGTYYECYNGRSVTGNVAASSETNSIILSCWIRAPSGSGGNGVQGFSTWGGEGATPALFSAIIGGTWYVGVRSASGNYYFSAALSDTASFHHQFYSYKRSAGDEVIAYLDGVKLTSSAGSPLSLAIGNGWPLTLGAYASGTNVLATVDKAFVSHGMVFTNYAGNIDLLASNIYANGRNYYDPPAAPSASNPDDNYRAAALWWRMIAK